MSGSASCESGVKSATPNAQSRRTSGRDALASKSRSARPSTGRIPERPDARLLHNTTSAPRTTDSAKAGPRAWVASLTIMRLPNVPTSCGPTATSFCDPMPVVAPYTGAPDAKVRSTMPRPRAMRSSARGENSPCTGASDSSQSLGTVR